MPTFFGEVADQPSRDLIDAIDAVETGAQDRPTVNVVTSSITRNRTNGPAPWGNSSSKSGTLNASINPSLPTPAAPATASADVLSRVGGGCFKELQMNVGTCFHQYQLCSITDSEFRLPTVAFVFGVQGKKSAKPGLASNHGAAQAGIILRIIGLEWHTFSGIVQCAQLGAFLIYRRTGMACTWLRLSVEWSFPATH